MILGERIKELVSLLEKRRTLIFHACQLRDFQTYLKVGGIPSRDFLVQKKQVFTVFETDKNDQINGVLDKVFANLSDFGMTFANGGAGVPNPYGPILLQINPIALLEASDVAICLRSAGATNFNRQKEALKTNQDIDRIFLNSSDSAYPFSTYIKFKDKLQEDFGYPNAHDPEISLSIESGMLSLEYVAFAKTDPYMIGRKSLRMLASEYISSSKFAFSVKNRNCIDPKLYSELAQFAVNPKETLSKISQNEETSPSLKKWAKKAIGCDLEWQYERFAKYLREGTLQLFQ